MFLSFLAYLRVTFCLSLPLISFSWVFFFPFSCLGISLESWFLLDLSAYPWEFCVGCDVINAWDDIKSFSFCLDSGESFELLVCLLVCLSVSWDFQLFSWYTYYHRLAKQKRVHSPVGKIPAREISSFYTNTSTVETNYLSVYQVLACHFEFIQLLTWDG